MLAACGVFAMPAAHAASANPAGVIKTSKGSVTIEREGRKMAGPVGATVLPSDRIVTGVDGSAGITLRDETLLALGPNTTLALDKFAFDSTTHAGALDASVKRGTLAVISGKLAKQSPGAVKFTTPSTVLGVRGTEFVIEVGEQ
ncbi:FecR family protein [Pseudoduganella namucuonensis]|uniref:FecR family protein n=2 Tax=Pseudoduganella namucuonensis TaxID=1035707 RepID=A0A1I7M2M7_9BURK|nr:FecR family protein [Pseudoduganella namucuonensis]